MELKDTVQKMTSPDYKERMVAEYQQTKIRYEKLKAINNKIEAGYETRRDYLNFKPDCPPELLRHQQQAMGEYLHCLEVRAVIEGVELG